MFKVVKISIKNMQVLVVEWLLGRAQLRVHLCSLGSPCRAASLSSVQIASGQRPETQSRLPPGPETWRVRPGLWEGV